MKQTLDSIVNRLNELENLDCTQQEFIHKHEYTHKGIDPEITIIAKNITQEPSENIIAIASGYISLINDSVTITAEARLKSRRICKLGLVKINMKNLEEKRLVIREKRKLRQTEQFKPAFLRDSKSHTDSIKNHLEQDDRTLTKQTAERKSILNKIKRTNRQKVAANKSC